ncbi:hypothetical protein Goklo_002758, partial [Gossypium klotzschianum]|nr:hypothetical protein [Gossypium klotzschianum]
VARVLDQKAVSDFITILWNVWSSRNNFIFRGIDEEAKVIWERAASLSHNFRIFNLLEKPMLPRSVVVKVWMKPPQGVVKINFDATVAGKKTSYGLLARDSDGFVLGGRAGVLDKDLQIEWGEMQSLGESINFVRSNNWSKMEFETDCVSLVNRFNKRNEDLTTIADHLCKFAMDKNCTLDFNVDYPLDIH